MSFTVFIVPMRGGTVEGRHASYTQKFIDALRDRGVRVVELLGPIEPAHYFPHNLHFNSEGARSTAQAILGELAPAGRGTTGRSIRSE